MSAGIRQSRFVPEVLVRSLLWLTSLAGASAARAKEKAPDWLEAVAKAPVTVETKDAAAVVLLNEGTVRVVKEGALTTRVRYAVRILTAAGRRQAAATVPYLAGSSEVRNLKAWLIKPTGPVSVFEKKDVIDVALYTSAMELYGEQRAKTVQAQNRAEVGAVFGFEAEITEKTLLTQRRWRFQELLPMQHSSFSIQLPPGWRPAAQVFNHPGLEPVVRDSTWTWKLSALPAIVAEPMGPPASALVPWLAVNLIPPAGRVAGTDQLQFESWEAIAAYFSPRYDAAAALDPALRQRAAAVVGNANSPWEKIQALARAVQRVNYISIQLDAAQAGGMIPRPATRVLQCNYGDCKDKTTLLRAMLASEGIKSWPLIVAAGARKEVRPEWPSPTQFNHCILAIQLPEPLDQPAVLEHPTLGRLLIFDPTDEFTPLGLLAGGRLADRALLLAGAQSSLITLPPEKIEGDRLERNITARLDEYGSIAVTVREEFSGLASSRARHQHSRDDRAGFERRIEKWVATTVAAPLMRRVEPRDDFAAGKFELEAEFVAAGYAKLMQNKLIVFKPALVARPDSVPLKKEKRTQPVVLSPSRYQERAEFTLPKNWEVDETVPPLKLETVFGNYQSRTVQAGELLVFERSLELKEAEIPPTDYEQVRTFFEKIVQNEQSPVVLRRKL